MKLLRTGLLYLFFLSVIGAVILTAAIWIAGSRSVPPESEELSLPGLAGQVTVSFDSKGVPTIQATSMRDAYRALGYLHARDRLWQMEATRRVGAGRMAEIAGPPMVGYDTLMRELGLYHLAEAQAASLPDQIKADFQAYADGVNAYLSAPPRPLPVEFQVTQHEPEPWTIPDSLVWAQLMSLQLSGDAFQEAPQALLVDHLGQARADQFHPRYDGSPTSLNPQNRDGWLNAYDASNAWALAGSRTQSGKPVLANDPHLPLGMPAQWYLVRIETPELTLTGATPPGIPLHVLGHNGTIAWGMTTTHADTQDTVLLSEEEVAQAQSREEEIKVRFGDPVPLTIRESQFGPIITRLSRDQPTALQWTALRMASRAPIGVYRLNRAKSWPDFLAALSLIDDPVQNVFYADIQGHIGMKVAGTLPQRAKGRSGSVPASSTDATAAWRGLIPSEALPGISDPRDGLIWNANNRVIDDAYPHQISHSFAAPFRAQRLQQRLSQETKDHRIEDSSALQQDIVSQAATVLVPYFVTADPTSELAEKARQALASWDKSMDAEKSAPSIYMVMLNEFVRLVAQDDLEDIAFPRYWRADPGFAQIVLRDAPDWCDDHRTEPVEDCHWALTQALDRSVFVLEDKYGDSVEDWHWGKLHEAPMKHRLLDALPFLSRLGNSPIVTSGGDDTLNRAQSHSGSKAPPFADIHGPGYRAVYDLSDLDSSLFALAGGQSGNPFSPHYDDLLPDWRDGRYFKIPRRGGDRTEDDSAILILNP